MNYGDVALGMLVSLIGWAVFIFVVFLPKIKGLKTYFEGKEKLYMDKIDTILKGDDSDFNAILDKKLPLMFDAAIKKLGQEPTAEMKETMSFLARGAFYAMTTDPEIKLTIQGKINGYMNGIVGQIENRFNISEQDMKDLHEFIEWAKEMKTKYGGDKEGGGGTGNPLLDMFMGGMGGMVGQGGGGMGPYPM